MFLVYSRYAVPNVHKANCPFHNFWYGSSDYTLYQWLNARCWYSPSNSVWMVPIETMPED